MRRLQAERLKPARSLKTAPELDHQDHDLDDPGDLETLDAERPPCLCQETEDEQMDRGEMTANRYFKRMKESSPQAFGDTVVVQR